MFAPEEGEGRFQQKQNSGQEPFSEVNMLVWVCIPNTRCQTSGPVGSVSGPLDPQLDLDRGSDLWTFGQRRSSHTARIIHIEFIQSLTFEINNSGYEIMVSIHITQAQKIVHKACIQKLS